MESLGEMLEQVTGNEDKEHRAIAQDDPQGELHGFPVPGERVDAVAQENVEDGYPPEPVNVTQEFGSTSRGRFRHETSLHSTRGSPFHLWPRPS